MRARSLRGVLLGLACAWLASSRPEAATPLVATRVSPDITVTLDGTVVNDEDVATDDLAGTVTLQSIGTIPPQADLDAYNVRQNGDQLLSFDTAVALPGGLTARPGDVVRFDGASYFMEFDAAARGIPAGARVDAVAVYGSSLLLSFDVAVDVNGLHIDREDLARFDGAAFTLFFDGSAAGIGSGLNLDAADYLDCNDHLFLSFDGSGSVGGVTFDDDDVLEFDRVATWELAYDGSTLHPEWASADLDAVHVTPDLGPGPPAVFGQTVLADADKATFRWPSSVVFRAVRGSFVSSADIGAYVVDFKASGNGTSLSDPATPAAGTGYWYLVKRGGCLQSSWQSTLGVEPGRDNSIP